MRLKPVSPYSALSDADQSALSVLLEGSDRKIAGGEEAFHQLTLDWVPARLRTAYFLQLLPRLVVAHRERTGLLPTRAELQQSHPTLRTEIAAAYRWLPKELRLPVRIGPYRVVANAGGGGQAVVLRCQDELHSPVAVKLSIDPRHNDRIERERDTLVHCRHPSVVEVVGSDVLKGRSYYAMPFLAGRTLSQRWERPRPSPRQALAVALQLCDAIANLHDKGVLHRDIKPDNVWIDDADRIKLIDLGMAIEGYRFNARRAPVEEFHGTAAYMSPEQASCNSELDGEPSDLFAIGATLFWMLTGSAPFRAERQEESLALAAAWKIDPAALAKLREQPEAAQRACLTAMAPRPDQRPPTARALRGLLLAADEELASAERWRQRRRRLPLIAGAGLVAMAAVYLAEGAIGTPPRVELPRSLRPDAWIEEVRDESGIDLARVTSADFRVRVGCAQRIGELSSAETAQPSSGGVLAVACHPRLAPLLDSLAYRVGASRWRGFAFRDDQGNPFAILDPHEAQSDAAVELRLGSPDDAATSAGPFVFPLRVASAIAEDARAVADREIAAAAAETWLVDGLGGWQVSPAFLERYGSLVESYLLQPEEGGEALAVPASLPPDNAADPSAETLPERFKRLCEPIQSHHALWARLRLRTGVLTEARLVRRKNSYGNDGTVASARRVLENLPPELPVAYFRAGKFNLAGLALADLALRSVEVGPTALETEAVLPVRRLLAKPNAGPKTPLQLAQRSRHNVLHFHSERLIFDEALLQVFDGECYGASLPPIWKSVYIRGVFYDGSKTPAYRIDNEAPLPGYELPCVSVSPGGRRVRTYLYGFAPTADGLPMFRPQTDVEWGGDAWLYSLTEVGASVEYCEDPLFRKRLSAVRPGIVYARHHDGRKTFGGCAYKIDTDRLARLLAEAAKVPSSVEKPAPPLPPPVSSNPQPHRVLGSAPATMTITTSIDKPK